MPTNGMVTSQSNLTVRGTAEVTNGTDIVNLVEISLNSQPYSAVVGTTSWEKELILVEGTNTLIAKATTSLGISSTSAPIKVIYSYSDSTNLPAIPQNLFAIDVSTNQVVLSWNAVLDADSYNLYRSTNLLGIFNLLTNISLASYVDVQVEMGVTYFYQVTAVNENGESGVSIPALAIVPTPANMITLTLLHLNDTHGHLEAEQKSVSAFPATGNRQYFNFGGMASVKTRIDEIRAENENVLLLHSGDVYNGTLYSEEFEGIADLVMLKQMQCDVMGLGNHEFDCGVDSIDRFVDEAVNGSSGSDIYENTGTENTFPIVCANLDASGESGFDEDNLVPFIITNIDGRDIGIFGLINEDTPMVSGTGPNLVFANEITKAQEAITALTASNVNIIIALTHIGVDNDRLLAQNVDGIDVIVGGHSHTRLGDFEDFGLTSSGNYPIVEQGPEGDDVLIVHAGMWAWILGQLEVTFNSLGKIDSYSGKPELIIEPYFLDSSKNPVDNVESNLIASYINNHPYAALAIQDPDAVAALQPYKAVISSLATNVIANASGEIIHRYVPDDSADPGSFGPIIADAYMWKLTNSTANPYEACNFVIMHSGGIRASIMSGDDIDTSDGTPPITITVTKVFEVSPFGNTLVVVDISASELYDLIEDCCDTPGGFANVSGMRYSVTDTESYPSGATNNSVTCESIYWTQGTNALANGGLGVLLDRNDTTVKYKLVLNSFSAAGGDFYDTTAAMSDTRKYDTGFVDAYSILEYYRHLDAHGMTVDPIPSTNRITYTTP